MQLVQYGRDVRGRHLSTEQPLPVMQSVTNAGDL